MKVNGDGYSAYAGTGSVAYAKKAEQKTEKKTDDVKAKDQTAAKPAGEEAGVTLEISSNPEQITKMSEADRKALVQELKAEQDARQSQMISMVQQMMAKQTSNFAISNNTKDVWRFLASGKFTVDAQTKAEAQEAISEDGYYGVKQTSERLFKFALAVAGDDEEKMHKMQDAMQKGFKQAEKTWGKELPEISQQTMQAANKLFEDYFAGKTE